MAGADRGAARDAILGRLRADTTRPSPPAHGAPGTVAREAVPAGDGPPFGELTALLTDRLLDYRATVRHCAPDGVAGALADLLAGVPELVVPPGLPGDWLTAYPGVVRRDGTRPLTVAELDVPGLAVLTGCAVAVAETGTLLLDAGPDQGRRLLTLVPDHHICVVRRAQVVAGVSEALRRLDDPTRPLTLISGPSATSDIELNRVEGVHGPRRLEVLLVG